VFAGSLGQQAYALSAADGQPLSGWPFFASDSNFSTADLADLYGTGQLDVVEGGDQTAGFALGQSYPQGGHLRVFSPRGALICDYHADQTVDSSPAVGNFLAGGAAGIVVGTGSFFPGASDTDTLKAFDADCQLQWSARLDGATTSSPALADVEGNGRLEAVEGTDTGSGGSVWVLDAATGQIIWNSPVVSRVIGSVVTADLTGEGYQDLLVPTTHGVEILNGRTGGEVGLLGSLLGFQSAPLVTDDPGGIVGITIAGYNGNNQGVIEHFQIPGSNGALAVAAGSWPEFHHDPALDGNVGQPLRPWPACLVPSAARPGYEMVAADGGVFPFGEPFCGSTGGLRLRAPVVALGTASNRGGYWLAASDGGVFSFGGAPFFGSLGQVRLAQPIVGLAVTPDGGGYWLVAADGGVFAFGDARFFGSTGNLPLASPVRGMSTTADGLGYLLVASDGGVFRFGDALFLGSMARYHLQKPIVGIAIDNTDGGYWLVGADGGIFSFGAPFFGSTGSLRLAGAVVGLERTADSRGYRMVAADGGVFDFGDAGFYGSVGGHALNQPMVGIGGS
jgi:outer membrane protein assembly factor BamB